MGKSETITKLTSRKQSSTVDHQHRSLPEVSVNPQIQSSVQQNIDQLPYLNEPNHNGRFEVTHLK